MLILGLSTMAFANMGQGSGKHFEANKAKILERQAKVTSCIKAATDRAALKECKKVAKAERKAAKAERQKMKADRMKKKEERRAQFKNAQ